MADGKMGIKFFMEKMKKKRQFGFLLMEVLISISIITIGTFYIFSSLSEAIQGSADTKRKVIAINLAQRIMETYEGMQVFPKMPFSESGNMEKYASEDVFSLFEYEINIKEVNDSRRTIDGKQHPFAQLFEITVSVSWPFRVGERKEVDLSTWMIKARSRSIRENL